MSAGDKTIADAVRLADGSILDFNQIAPPDSGTVLFFGGNDDIGFIAPSDMPLDGDVSGDMPEAPTQLNLVLESFSDSTGTLQHKILMTWIPPVSSVDGEPLIGILNYIVYAKTNPDDSVDYTPVATIEPELAIYNFVAIQTSVTYYLAICAVNLDGTVGEPAESSIVVPAGGSEGTLTGPANLIVTPLAYAGTALISWDQIVNTSLKGYRVEFQTSASVDEPSWAAWSDALTVDNSFFLFCTNGTLPSTQWLFPQTVNWVRFRVRAELFSGKAGAWSSSSSGVTITYPGTAIVQYSVTGASLWHSPWVSGDIYMRMSLDDGATWETMRVIGETGSTGGNGNFFDYWFAKNTSSSSGPTKPADNVASPSSPWQADPPTLGSTEYCWMTKTLKTSAGACVNATNTWSAPMRLSGVQGPQGAQGPQGSTGTTGPAGSDGHTNYFHVAYATSFNGSTGFNQTSGPYIGTYVDETPSDSGNYLSYTWRQFIGSQGTVGDQGIPGVDGEDGSTSYLHIKYSDNGTSFTANGGETPGKWLGTYVDFTQADSSTFSAYTWVKVEGPTGPTGSTWDTVQHWKDDLIAAGGIQLNQVGEAGCVINGTLVVDKISSGTLGAAVAITIGSGNNKIVIDGTTGIRGYWGSSTPSFTLSKTGLVIGAGATITSPTISSGTISGTDIYVGSQTAGDQFVLMSIDDYGDASIMLGSYNSGDPFQQPPLTYIYPYGITGPSGADYYIAAGSTGGGSIRLCPGPGAGGIVEVQGSLNVWSNIDALQLIAGGSGGGVYLKDLDGNGETCRLYFNHADLTLRVSHNSVVRTIATM